MQGAYGYGQPQQAYGAGAKRPAEAAAYGSYTAAGYNNYQDPKRTHY